MFHHLSLSVFLIYYFYNINIFNVFNSPFFLVFFFYVLPDPPAFPNDADEELKLSADGEVTLNCTAAGNPVPAYSWQFPHEIQQTSEKKNANQPVVTIQLAGTYPCTVSNSQGRATKVFTVIQERSKLLQLHFFISTPLFI